MKELEERIRELEERIRELEEENKRLKCFIWELADENGEIYKKEVICN